MTSLPLGPFYLHGGCHCSAIRYTISFANFDDRPVLNPNHPPEQPDIKAPLLCFDHCSDCRSASGVPVQFWNICPQKSVTFSLLRRCDDGSSDPVSEPPSGARIDITGDRIVHPNEMTKETYLTYYASSKSVWRTFCSQCGTNISFVAFEEEGSETLMDLGVGTLDHESLQLVGTPQRHIWWDSGIDWVKQLMEVGEMAASQNALPKHSAGNIYEIIQETSKH
ncbi:hypothetical protein AJ78_05094 [Emergomyces pasteurianus Ep9510]|uniref:Uncharacterized protein n=1 Tax=Emergomyces pasteurianus Ep9510 TaxID=1447872 RepID=A0A1J9PDB5_9EURO|nr:hypothetical protein AJ78_05094 [Emergomyces pasteurianus Ep9510]